MNTQFHFRPELIHAIDLLELKPKQRLASPFVGEHESHSRGAGMHFKEFRPYEFGDDIRHISWSTTARTGKPTLKVYDEEREIHVFIVVDISGSSLFGSGERRKIDMYSEVVALIAMSALKYNYRFGSVFTDSEVQSFSPPTRKKEEILSGVNQLQTLNLQKRQSDLRPALQLCNRLLKHKTLLIILSDFILPPFQAELHALSTRHEIILMQGYDDSERFLSSKGISEICDPETGQFFVMDSESPFCRRAVQSYYATFLQNLEKVAQQCRADFLPLSVQDDYLQRVVHFFNER